MTEDDKEEIPFADVINYPFEETPWQFLEIGYSVNDITSILGIEVDKVGDAIQQFYIDGEDVITGATFDEAYTEEEKAYISMVPVGEGLVLPVHVNINAVDSFAAVSFVVE